VAEADAGPDSPEFRRAAGQVRRQMLDVRSVQDADREPMDQGRRGIKKAGIAGEGRSEFGAGGCAWAAHVPVWRTQRYFRYLGEVGNADQTPLSTGAPVAPAAFDLAEGVGGQVAFAAVRADDNRHVLDDKQTSALAVALGDTLGSRTFSTAYIADHLVIGDATHFQCIRQCRTGAADSMRRVMDRARVQSPP